MAMVLITAPLSQPVTLASIKGFMKIENTDDDQLITDLIDQAVSHIQNITGLKLITQSWRLFYDNLPVCRVLQLPLGPVIAPIEIRLFDDQGVAQIIPADDYQLDIHSSPARLWFNNQLCPGQELNGIELDLQIGFGPAGIDVPGDIIRAIMLTIAHWYEFRGAVQPADQPLSNPEGLSKLLAPYLKVKL